MGDEERARRSSRELDFLRWASRFDTFFVHPSLDMFGDLHGVRGVHALNRIAAGELLLSIPLSMILHVSPLIQRTHPGTQLHNSAVFEYLVGYFGVDKFVKTVLLLLHELEHEPTSPFGPYLQILPGRGVEPAVDCPLKWTDAQLDWLKGTSIDAINRTRPEKRIYTEQVRADRLLTAAEACALRKSQSACASPRLCRRCRS